MTFLAKLFVTLFILNNIKAASLEATVDLSIYGVLSESCEYDAANNLIYVQRRDATPNGIASITSDVTKLASNDTEYSFPVVEGIAENGMVLMDNKLYIANFAGNFTVYDIQNGNVIASEFIRIGINGLCNDPDNPMIFYTTAVGIDFRNSFRYDNSQAIWMIDTSVSPYDITQILDNNTMISGNPVFPNGCIVSNGVVYLVETKLDFTGSIVMYDINTGAFSLSGTGIGSGDGIVTDGNGRFWMSQWGSFNATDVAGTIVQFDVANDNVMNIKTIVDDIVSPADICIDIDNGIIYAPSLQTGLLYAIEVNTTQPTITTTMDASASIISVKFSFFVQILFVISIIMM